MAAVLAISPVGVSALQGGFRRGLGHHGAAQGNRNRLKLRRIDLEIVVDAITHYTVAGGRDQLILGIGRKGAVAGIVLLIVFALDDEKTVTLDGQVGGAVGRGDRTLREIRRNLCHLHAEALLLWIGAAVGGGGRGTNALRLQELRGKEHVGGLEAHSVRVGQVVADDVDLRFRGTQARQGRAHGGC